jgi:hypothetical protein
LEERGKIVRLQILIDFAAMTIWLRRQCFTAFVIPAFLGSVSVSNGFTGSSVPVSRAPFGFKVSALFSSEDSSIESEADIEPSDVNSDSEEGEETDAKFVEAVPLLSSVTDPEAVQLREKLLELAEATKKGFSASPSQKKRAREIIFDLARFNPTKEPLAPYYTDDSLYTADESVVSLAGKWELVYTDAPDITALDTSRNPLATAKLGRIGQECSPPFIKNVIEWQRPDWAEQLPLPFTGNEDSRILQKVCTKATASPDKPFVMNLKLAGFELVAPPSSKEVDTLRDAIEQEGLPAGFLRNKPVELQGPLTAPFGEFELLYIDEEMRIVRTGQNYVAVNLRVTDEWF